MIMKRRILCTLLLATCCIKSIVAQQIVAADSVKYYSARYASTKSDANLFKLYFSKSRFFRRLNNDSSLFYGNAGVSLARKNHNVVWQLDALANVEYALQQLGDLAEALKLQFEVLALTKQRNVLELEGETLNSIGNTYLDMDDAGAALKYYQLSRDLFKKLAAGHMAQRQYWLYNETSNMGNAYEILNMPDSALFYELKILNSKHFPNDLRAELLSRIGNAYVKLKDYSKALVYYNSGLKFADSLKTAGDIVQIDYQLAKLYDKKDIPDSAILYARKGYIKAEPALMRVATLNLSKLLADLYRRKSNVDSTAHYQQLVIQLNDTLFGVKRFNRIQHVLSDEQQRQEKLLQEQEKLTNRYRLIVGSIVMLFLLTVTFLIWVNYRSQRKKNALLNAQNEQITEHRDELQRAFDQLRQTQNQLVQSEKMAALGELTAGIAHEIQNPLNFVNNFSDVSVELLAELKEEEEKGSKKDVMAIADDLTLNLQKIRHHGKRADAIVKGMLQHSRTSSGEKEPIDINALADEYLRLAYHGLRAKDKAFNAELVTDFQSNLPTVNAIPQDIGRVLLNVINNAFYATKQKAKMTGGDYKPIVEVSTAQQNGTILIKVKDNGTGIPENIREKVMQPFFTTKPTGEGTGLGLSLSYDIVVKGHGGKIAIDSREGQYSVFTITLPLS